MFKVAALVINTKLHSLQQLVEGFYGIFFSIFVI
jgi:hypothetical protein